MAEKMTLFKSTVESKHKQVKKRAPLSSRTQPKSVVIASKLENKKPVKKLSSSDEYTRSVAIIPRVLMETSQAEQDVVNGDLNESGANVQHARMQRLEKLMSDLNVEMRFGLFKNNPEDLMTVPTKVPESAAVAVKPRVVPKRKKRRLCEKRHGKCKKSACRHIETEVVPKVDNKCLRDASNTHANNQKQLVRTLKKRKQKLVLESVGYKLPGVKREVDSLASRILDSKTSESTNRPEFFKVAVRNLEYQINDLKLRLSDRDAFGKIIQLEAELKQIQQHMLQSGEPASRSVLNDSATRSYELYDQPHDSSDRTADYVRRWMERNMPRPHTSLSSDRLDLSHVTVESGHENRSTIDTAVGGRHSDTRHAEWGSVSGSQRQVTDPAPLTDRSNHSRSTLSRTDNKLPVGGSLIVERDISFKNSDAVGGDAFATVFRGTFQNNTVAVKQLRAPLSAQDTNYFLSETTLLCDINHSCVTRILGACASSALPLLVTEYVAGGTLFHRLMDSTRPPLDLSSYVRVATDIARGLHYLHHHQPIILHLDLTSRSVLLTPSLRAKVTDFGFSKLRHDAVCAKQSAGGPASHTLAWMAPELIDHGAISPRADVYSYAIILWQMLTRAELYPGLSTYEVLEIVRRGLRPQLPGNCLPQLRDLINICWHHDAASRPSFKEVLKAMRGLRTGTGKTGSIPQWQAGGRPSEQTFSDTELSDEETGSSSSSRHSVMEERHRSASVKSGTPAVEQVKPINDRPPAMAWTDWTTETSTGRREPTQSWKGSGLDTEQRSRPSSDEQLPSERSKAGTSTEGRDVKRHVARKMGDGAYAVDSYYSHAGHGRLKDTHLDDCCVGDAGKKLSTAAAAGKSTSDLDPAFVPSKARGGGEGGSGDTWIDEMIARFAAQLEQHRPPGNYGNHGYESLPTEVNSYHRNAAPKHPTENYSNHSNVNATHKQPMESFSYRGNGIRKQPSESMFADKISQGYAELRYQANESAQPRLDRAVGRNKFVVGDDADLTVTDVEDATPAADVAPLVSKQYTEVSGSKRTLYSPAPQVTSTPSKPASDAVKSFSDQQPETLAASRHHSLPYTTEDARSSTFAKYGLAEWKVKADQSPDRVKVIWEEKPAVSSPSVHVVLPQA